MYLISQWNLYERVKNGQPRTNNKTERYNQQIQTDAGNNHLTVCQMIENLRLEQGNTERLIVKINMGHVNTKKNVLQEMDEMYLNLVANYNKEEILEFLISISRVIEKFNIKINQKLKKQNVLSESEEDE